MKTIRPYQLFQLVDGLPVDRIVNAVLPSRPGTGSVSLLESFLLIAATRAINAWKLFEFGTFLGGTTFNLALNIPDGGEVFTLEAGDPAIVQHPTDASIAELRARASTLDFAGHPVERKIRRLTGDSRTFDFSPLHGIIEFVFIDGGHDLETVRSDTENAFLMLRKYRPTCIMWHDYRHHDYPELTSYLDALSGERPMVSIGDTMLCAHFSEESF